MEFRIFFRLAMAFGARRRLRPSHPRLRSTWRRLRNSASPTSMGTGQDDIVHLTRVNQTASTVIWNRFPRFVQTTTGGLVLPSVAATSWQLTDIDGDDRPELVSVPSGTIVTIPVQEPRIHSRRKRDGGERRHKLLDRRRNRSEHAVSRVAACCEIGWRASERHERIRRRHKLQLCACGLLVDRRFLGFGHTESSDGERLLQLISTS